MDPGYKPVNQEAAPSAPPPYFMHNPYQNANPMQMGIPPMMPNSMAAGYPAMVPMMAPIPQIVIANNNVNNTQQHTQATSVVQETRRVHVPIQLGDRSQRMTCPHCDAVINTSVKYDGFSTMAHAIALVLCIVGFWPCCLFPYCMDSCKNVEHECPNCGRHLGSFKR